MLHGVIAKKSLKVVVALKLRRSDILVEITKKGNKGAP